MRQVVKVEAAVEQLNTSSNTSNATLGNVVSKETVVNLPSNGRNPLNLFVS